MQGDDWMDMDDPSVIAEQELLAAASSIDAAASKLASLQQRVVLALRIHYALYYAPV